MSAGMMPALDLPGLIRPGQFGPMIRVCPCRGVVEELGGVLDGHALGDDDGQRDAGVDGLDDGALVKAGGTKMTETSAPVASIASA
jgi:hypothetical protein